MKPNIKLKTKKQKIRGGLCAAFALVTLCGGLTGCSQAADVASQNLSTAADNFQIDRQINFVDTITGQNLVTVKGLCSLGNNDVYPEISVTCKTGPNQYIKDFFEVTPTTTVATVQLGSAAVSSAQYSVVWNPATLVPDFNSVGGPPLTPSAGQPSSSASAPAAGTSTTLPTKTVVVVPIAPRPSPTAGA